MARATFSMSQSPGTPRVYARIFSANKSSWCTQAGQKSKAQLRGFSDFYRFLQKSLK